MLRRFLIQDRSPDELQQLALERRGLAGTTKSGKIKALLLQEAIFLDFHADMKRWMRAAEHGVAAGVSPEEKNHGTGAPCRDFGNSASALNPFLKKLGSRAALTMSDQQALLQAALPLKQSLKGDILLGQDEEVSSLLILCDGVVQSVRGFSDGSQQVVGIFIAGDAVNCCELVSRRVPNTIRALTPATYLNVPLASLEELLAARPAIARALWLETAAQAAIQQEWMVWISRRSAQTRLAHFLCELSYRLKNSNGNDAYEFPLSQRELADVLGLSTVHVNRCLQILRSQGLIQLNRNRLTILDKRRLHEIAEFDPEYLGARHIHEQAQ
jgi:CRP-like cAMP-binding protein